MLRADPYPRGRLLHRLEWRGCGLRWRGAGAQHGDDAQTGGDDDTAEPKAPVEIPSLATRSGLRRLTANEYDKPHHLLGDNTRPAAEFLPADALARLDKTNGQVPSEALIIGAERLAGDAAQRLLDRPGGMPRLLSKNAPAWQSSIKITDGRYRLAHNWPMMKSVSSAVAFAYSWTVSRAGRNKLPSIARKLYPP